MITLLWEEAKIHASNVRSPTPHLYLLRGLLFHVWLVAAAQFNPHEDSNCRVSAAHNREEKFK